MKSSYNGRLFLRRQTIGYSGGELQVRTRRLSHSSKEMVLGEISGKRRGVCSMPRWSRLTAEKRRVAWFECFAGEKAFNSFNEWLPGDTLTPSEIFAWPFRGR